MKGVGRRKGDSRKQSRGKGSRVRVCEEKTAVRVAGMEREEGRHTNEGMLRLQPGTA